jgi:HD-GYP domain-containing protein (c-di-GMP phosphodiesterase class II)
MSYDDVKKIIVNGRGQHFDPDMVDAFLAKYTIYCDIADRHRDSTGFNQYDSTHSISFSSQNPA